MKILIIGCNSFIGSNFLSSLNFKKYNVYLLGRNKPKLYFSNKFKFIKHDFSKHIFKKKLEVHVIYFLIGEHKSKNLEKIVRGNYTTLKNFLESKNIKFKKIIFISSHKIYGDIDKININESTALIKTNDNYAKQKIRCENLLKKYSIKNQNIVMIILRYCGFFEKGSFFFDAILRLKQNKLIEIYNLGKSKRDYLFIKNSNKALKLVLSYNRSGLSIFNIGSGQIINNYKIITFLKDRLGSKSKLLISSKKNYIGNFHFNINKARKYLNYKPENFNKLLKNYIKFL